MPISAALPILREFKATFKLNPRPFAPINAAIVVIAKHCIITWFTPIRISLLAVGISTLNNSWNLLHPLMRPDSITSGDIFFNPRIVSLTIGGVAKIIVAIDPAWSPTPNRTTIGTK